LNSPKKKLLEVKQFSGNECGLKEARLGAKKRRWKERGEEKKGVPLPK